MSDLTDLEITRLCAEAMGYYIPLTQNPYDRILVFVDGKSVCYNPLHDDAQCMALVKKCGLDIEYLYWDDPMVKKHDAHGKILSEAQNKDLNHAICECVAKLQKQKP